MKHFQSIVFALLLAAPAFSSAADAATLTANISYPSLSSSIPQGAQRVEMASLELSASCDGDVTVRELHVKHAGLGDDEDIARIYALSDNRRISRTTGFSGQQRTATLRLSRFIIPSCTQRTIHIVADFSATAVSGGEHRIEFPGEESILSDAETVILTTGNAAPTVRTTPSSAGNITVTYLPVRTSVRYGANRVVARLKLEADGNDDHAITAITLTNDGSASNGELQNLFLETANGTRLGTTLKSLDGDTARFTFSPPLLLEGNESRTIEVHADVRAGKRRTIRLIVEETSDIESTIAKQRGGRFQ